MSQEPGQGQTQPKDNARTAYGMFVRGFEIEQIAREMGVPEPDVAAWVGERAARASAPADALRVLKRHLFTHLEASDSKDKPKFASALAAIESKLVQFDGRCGARTRSEGTSGFCQAYPEKGRTRCGKHGGRSKYGEASATYVHGGRSKYPVELDEAEQVRYEDYAKQAYDAAADLALARIMRDRAIGQGGSGVAEGGLVDRLLKTHTAITKGMTVRVVPDEAAITRFMDVLMLAVERRVMEALAGDPGRRILALIALDVREVDWNTVVAIPAVAAAVAEAAEAAKEPTEAPAA